MPEDRFIHRRAGHSDKVTALSDLEFRVWTQYLLSADDFGVMRASADTLREANDALHQRPVGIVQKALKSLVAIKLLRSFTHNDRCYVFQSDWQDFQKVRYPARTSHPAPPSDECSVHTQHLIAVHPGGDRHLDSWRAPGSFKRPTPAPTAAVTPAPTAAVTPAPTAAVTPADSPRSRGGGRALPLAVSLMPLAVSHSLTEKEPEREGFLPLAFVGENGSRRPEGEIRADIAWENFKAAYPGARRQGGFMANQGFIGGCRAVGYTAIMASLERHKQSEQWKKGMVPKLENFVMQELWIQEPDTPETGAGGTDAAREHFRKLQERRKEKNG